MMPIENLPDGGRDHGPLNGGSPMQQPCGPDRARVLMFAYYFPPLGGSAVQRTLKYVKYLPRHGYDPTVITGRPRWLPELRDDRLARDIPESAVVVRARTMPLALIQGKLDGLLRRAGISSRLVAGALWPDELVGWVPAAVWHGLRVIRERRPAVMFSTSLPASSHLAALIVHRMTGVPWVADFRDSLTYDPGPEYTRARPPLRVISMLERRVVAEAAYVTVACDTIRLVDVERNDRRRIFIPNGFDPDDWTQDVLGASTPSVNRFRLSYVGSLYGSRHGSPVFDAVKELADRGCITPETFEMRIVGHVTLGDMDRQGVAVSATGFVDHARAVAEMLSATALFFHQPPEQLGASGKIYEYLASGRPILCVAHPDNAAFRLVRELGAGECADVRNPAAVASGLERLVERWKAGTLGSGEDVRREARLRFSREKLASDLAELFRECVELPL
jgi:glycosyltransferase involved in cell wall biosynthesis